MDRQKLPTCLICLIVKHYTPLSDRSKYLRLSKKFNGLLQIRPSELRDPRLIFQAIKYGSVKVVAMFINKFSYNHEQIYEYCLTDGKNKILRYFDSYYYHQLGKKYNLLFQCLDKFIFSTSKAHFLYRNIRNLKSCDFNVDYMANIHLQWLKPHKKPNFIKIMHKLGYKIYQDEGVLKSVLSHGNFTTIKILPLKNILKVIPIDKAIVKALHNTYTDYMDYLMNYLGEPHNRMAVFNGVKFDPTALSNYLKYFDKIPDPYGLMTEIELVAWNEKRYKNLKQCFHIVQDYIYETTGDWFIYKAYLEYPEPEFRYYCYY
jgi:hypothetical protein